MKNDISVAGESDGAQAYEAATHRIGRAWTGVMILIMLSVPVYICILLKTPPNLSTAFWAAFIPIILVNLPGGIAEIAIYAPLLGTGGTYLAFVTGNLSNLKIPCAMNACEMAKAEIGTKESEIVSTISVGVSALVTTLTIALGAMLIIPLKPVLESPVLLPAFKCVVPAVFGALGYKYAKNHLKIAILPMALSISLFLLFPSLTKSVSMLVFGVAVLSVVNAFFLYKKGWV